MQTNQENEVTVGQITDEVKRRVNNTLRSKERFLRGLSKGSQAG